LFSEEIDRISKIFKSIIKEKKPKVIFHHDCDGITSASIIIKMLLGENKNFELRMVKQLTSSVIEDLKIREEDFLILADLGSGQLDLLKNIFEKTHVLVLDHHEPLRLEHPNLFHLNPLIFDEEEISASMVCYLFAKSFDVKNADLVDLAIVGAVGDQIEEKWGFGGFARKILEEGEVLGKITISKGLRLYGRFTRPIHKSLEYSFNPFIPGISGSESNSVQFLSELGIPIKEEGEWKKLVDLSIEEQKKLASAIIIERLRAKHSEAENIFGEIYTIPGRVEEIQGVREFVTLLNATGRLKRQDIGIRLCFNDLTAIESSKEILNEYRKLVSEGIELVRQEKVVSRKENVTCLLFEDKILDTLTGTITSIALNSNLVDTSKPIFGFTYSNGNIKVSARVSKDLKINLRDIVVEAAKHVGGLGGGHHFASGALIPKNKEKEFVKIINNKLGDLFGKKD